MKVERPNVVSVYLSDEEFQGLQEFEEVDSRSRTQEVRLMMLKGMNMARREEPDKYGK